LPLGIATALGPFQLGENGVLRRDHADGIIEGKIDLPATAELLATERAVLPDDQVDLAGVLGLDGVELAPLTERGTGTGRINVKAAGVEIVHQ